MGLPNDGPNLKDDVAQRQRESSSFKVREDFLANFEILGKVSQSLQRLEDFVEA